MVYRSIFYSVTVALCAACGSDFSSAGTSLDGAAGAQQDAAPEASAGAAGSGSGGTSAAGAAGVSGAATGGQGGASSAGASGSAGDAGALDGGAGTGGSSGSGTAGATAVDAGPACSPDQVTLLGALPTIFAWPSWSYTWDGACIACAQSPCGTNLPLYLLPDAPTWANSELHLAVLIQSSYVSMRAGACGSESDCSFKPNMNSGVLVKLAPTDHGWSIISARPVSDFLMSAATCYAAAAPPIGSQTSLTASLTAALNTALVGLVLPCP